MPDFLDLLAFFFALHDYTQEYLMLSSDTAAIAALLVFGGGVFFWCMVIFMFFTGAFRLVRRGMWAVIDMTTPEPAVELPHLLLPAGDEPHEKR